MHTALLALSSHAVVMPLHTMTDTPLAQLRQPPAAGPYPAARYFTTAQDHFDESNTKTWQQAFFVNDTFFDGTGPVFLCVGGEGPALDGSAVVASAHCNDAVELLQAQKAIMFAVEHRYYGCHNASACPYTKADSEPLKWLSSRQALADLATFHSFATSQYGLTSPANKWVSFGGSYPGMLAGWFRVLYPSLVHASVSSSAPVVAKLDMTEYYDVASRAYSLPSVGGSYRCEQNIAGGHAAIGELMGTADGNAQLAVLFPDVAHEPAGWLNTTSGQRRFAGNGVISFPSQSNDPSCTRPNCDISHICQTVMAGPESKTPLERLSTLAGGPGRRRALRTVEEAETEEAQRRVEQPAVDSARGAERPTSPHATYDYWGYQTCTEFGFYQTCEVGSNCFFTQGLMTLDQFTPMCKTYGIDEDTIAKNIAATNAFYGAGRPDLAHNATRIFYVNGNVDPWSGLSILSSPAPTLPTLIVEGASHHAWTHPAAEIVQPSVVAAKSAIWDQVGKWLKEA